MPANEVKVGRTRRGLAARAATGDAGAMGQITVLKTGIANNTATAVIAVTVPNGNHNAGIFLEVVGHLGAGTDASESTRVLRGAVAIARQTGVAAVATAATAESAQIATTAGGGTLTLAYGVSAISGAVGATNTFNITVTAVVTGTITNHTALVSARLLNSSAGGVTIVAA